MPDLAGGPVRPLVGADQPHRTGTPPTARRSAESSPAWPMASRLSGASTSYSRDQEHAGGKPWPISHRRAVLGNPHPVRVGVCRRGRARAPSRQRFRAVVRSCCPRPGRSLRRWRSGSCSAFLGDPFGEGSDRQGTDHRTLFGQNQAHVGRIRPDLLTRIWADCLSRLGLSGDVWRRCCQACRLQSKPWRNWSNKNSANLACRDMGARALVRRRLHPRTDMAPLCVKTRVAGAF